MVSVSLLLLYTVPDGGPTRPTIDFPYLPFTENGTRPRWNKLLSDFEINEISEENITLKVKLGANHSTNKAQMFE